MSAAITEQPAKTTTMSFNACVGDLHQRIREAGKNFEAAELDRLLTILECQLVQTALKQTGYSRNILDSNVDDETDLSFMEWAFINGKTETLKVLFDHGCQKEAESLVEKYKGWGKPKADTNLKYDVSWPYLDALVQPYIAKRDADLAAAADKRDRDERIAEEQAATFLNAALDPQPAA